MMTFYLDAGPLFALAWLLKTQKVDLSSLDLQTLDICWAELERNEPNSAKRLSGQVNLIEMPADGKGAHVLYSRYRHDRSASTANLGEHATIAHLSADAPNAVFVTEEKTAAWLSLVELGGARTFTSLDLFAELRRRGLINKTALLRLATRRIIDRYALGIPGSGPPNRLCV